MKRSPALAPERWTGAPSQSQRPGGMSGLAAPLLLVIAASLSLAGCQSMPDDVLALDPQASAWRAAESRRFDNVDEDLLLDAAGSALQDLGFAVTRTQADAGLLKASKRGSAVSPGQVAGYIIIGAVLGTELPWDEEQEIRASLLVRQPTNAPDSVRIARLSLQREVWDYNGNVTRLEPIHDDAIFREFFDLLDASLFFEEEML